MFLDKNITVSFYLNKIIELTEKDDIEIFLDLYHNSLLGGHLGADKMHKTISKFYSWKNMLEDIKAYIRKCTVCEKTKITTHTKVPMEISSLGECLFDRVYIDFVGPIKQSTEGHKYIFTAECDLTKMVIAVPTMDCTAETAAECILENIIKYNIPSQIISDNASNFVSKVIKELCRLLSIQKIFSTPYHPQSNIVERALRFLNSFFRSYVNKNCDNWHKLLKYATFAYNNTVHTTTGYTPHELAHGFKIKIPSHLTKPKKIYNYDNYAEMTRYNITQALEYAKEQLYARKIENKKQYDKKLTI